MAFKWLSFITGFFYIVLGIAILFKKWFVIPLEDFATYGLGSLMVIYGLFRMIRAYYKFKQEKDEA